MMVVVVKTAFVMVEVVIRSNLIYILLGGGMCGVCSCGGVIVGYSVSSLTRLSPLPQPQLHHHNYTTTNTLGPPQPPPSKNHHHHHNHINHHQLSL